MKESNVRDFAVMLAEEGYASPTDLLISALKYMSCDQVSEMLKMNEYPTNTEELHERYEVNS